MIQAKEWLIKFDPFAMIQPLDTLILEMIESSLTENIQWAVQICWAILSCPRSLVGEMRCQRRQHSQEFWLSGHSNMAYSITEGNLWLLELSFLALGVLSALATEVQQHSCQNCLVLVTPHLERLEERTSGLRMSYLPFSVSLQVGPVKPSAQIQKKGDWSSRFLRQVPPFWHWFTSQKSPI